MINPSSGKLCPNRFVLGVALPRFAALLAAITAHFEATERRVRMIFVPTVQPYGARLDPISEAQGAAEIARLNSRGESEARIVGDADCVVLILERDDRQHGTENLLARYLQLVGCVGENGGLDEKALAVDLAGAAAGSQSRGALAFLDVAQDLFVFATRSDRSDHCCGIERVAERCSPRHGAQLLDDLVVTRSLDQQARSSDTNFALVPEDAPERRLNGSVDIGVGED